LGLWAIKIPHRAQLAQHVAPAASSVQVTLPATFLSRVLPALSSSLESLALLHVCGTQQEDMASLGQLTAVTSLRLIPSDHDLGGLEPLLAMKHLKKLSLK
jgi:hypothetical protein